MRKILKNRMVSNTELRGGQSSLSSVFTQSSKRGKLAVNIFLSISAFLGNFLILVALNTEYSLRLTSKLLYRCLATTDLLIGLVSQPLAATYWMSLVHEHWSLCRYARVAIYISNYALCLVSLSTLMTISVHRLLALLSGIRYRQIDTEKVRCEIPRENSLYLLITAKCSPCIVVMHCRKIRNQSYPLK